MTNCMAFKESHFDYTHIFVLEQKRSPLSSNCSETLTLHAERDTGSYISTEAKWIKVETL